MPLAILVAAPLQRRLICTLILGEAAKFLAVPYRVGDFRHGPLELANPELTALLLQVPLKHVP